MHGICNLLSIMSNNYNIDALKPVGNGHSISEVIFSIVLASPIINSSRYKALIEGGGPLSTEYKNFRITTGIKVNMIIGPAGIKPPKADYSKTGNDGFTIEKFDEGNLTWLIAYQPNNDETHLGQNLLRIHCLNYTRWETFFIEVIKLFGIISGFERLFISGYSLHYLDQFKWEGTELPEMQYIFKKDNYYLSNLFLDTKGPWNFASNTNRTIGGKLITENTNIGTNQFDSNNYIIYLFHRAATMFDEFKDLGQLLKEEELKQLADEMHTLNKNFLKETLNQNVQDLIGLK